MMTWALETTLWIAVTVVICIAIWGVNWANITIAAGISLAVSLLIGNSWRS